jgi:hypothetical protein
MVSGGIGTSQKDTALHNGTGRCCPLYFHYVKAALMYMKEELRSIAIPCKSVKVKAERR